MACFAGVWESPGRVAARDQASDWCEVVKAESQTRNSSVIWDRVGQEGQAGGECEPFHSQRPWKCKGDQRSDEEVIQLQAVSMRDPMEILGKQEEQK